jgi:hypothetical protein
VTGITARSRESPFRLKHALKGRQCIFKQSPLRQSLCAEMRRAA